MARSTAPLTVPRLGLSRRSLLGGAGALAAVPWLASCGDDSADTAGSGSGGSERTVRTCVYAKNHASSPLFWQQFAPDGWTVEVAVIESAAEVQQGLEAGTFDVGLMGVYNTILAADEGVITSKIVSMCARQGASLVVAADQGIESVADLAGKKLGVPTPGFQLLVLTTLLDRAGLRLGEDVEGIPLGYADQPIALERGDVDAYAGTEPLATQSIVSGAGVRLPEIYDTPAGDFNAALWASAEALKDEELIRGITKMQRDAAEYLTPGGENDPEVWRELLVDQFEYDEATYSEVLSNVGALWKFGEREQGQYRGAGKLLADQGTISAEPDYDALFAPEFWEA